MKYRIKYFGNAFGSGAFRTGEQSLRLEGYTAARQRRWAFVVAAVFIFVVILEKTFYVLGLLSISGWDDWIIFCSMLALCMAAYTFGQYKLDVRNLETFEKKFVTRIGRDGSKLSLDVQNPKKSGELLHVNFKAKNIAEANRIMEALSKEKEVTGTISVCPDVEPGTLSGISSKREIMDKQASPFEEFEEANEILPGKTQFSIEALTEGQEPGKKIIIPPNVERDLLSGQYSRNEIMIKYAMPAEELARISEILASKTQFSVEAPMKRQETGQTMRIPADVKRDILSGHYSRNEIMIKYAVPAEELGEIYKKLGRKA
jgi:hypothetical protein